MLYSCGVISFHGSKHRVSHFHADQVPQDLDISNEMGDEDAHEPSARLSNRTLPTRPRTIHLDSVYHILPSLAFGLKMA